MLFNGFLTSVSPLRVVETQNGTMSFNTITVECKTLTDKRLGMTFACKNELAKRVQEHYEQSAQQGVCLAVEVQFEPVLRTYERDGQPRVISENVALNITRIN